MLARPPSVLAVTVGDPRGIGPEIVADAVRALRDEAPDTRIRLLAPDETAARLHTEVGEGTVSVEGVGPAGNSNAEAGRASLAAIRRGVELCMQGEATALVTGPVHKPSLHAAGAHVPGQTELLGELTGAASVGMLMAAESSRAGPPLRILLATTHLALRDVPDAVTPERLRTQILLLQRALVAGWEIPAPRIALCALNPHASDEGLFGDEEQRILRPVVRDLRADGVDVQGPVPADTVFQRLLDDRSDAVVVPYHDVGMAVFKTLAFGQGVNVTLGLPFVRTSPDHGTAFDLAGKGIASPASMLQALRLAVRIGPGLVDGPPRTTATNVNR